MPAIKSDIMLTVRAGSRSISIGAVKLPDGRYEFLTLPEVQHAG